MAALTWTLVQTVPLVLIGIILIKILSVLKNIYKLKASFKDFPGPNPHWLWGNMQEVRSENCFHYYNMATRHLLMDVTKNVNCSYHLHLSGLCCM